MEKSQIKLIVIEAIFNNGELMDGDGHGILGPDYYINLGVPEEFVRSMVTQYRSNMGNHKETIYVKGEPVKELDGIHNLRFLERVADLLGADTMQADKMMGRGFRARCLCDAIMVEVRKHGKFWKCDKCGETKPYEEGVVPNFKNWDNGTCTGVFSVVQREIKFPRKEADNVK